jgi:DNA-binding MurR/RpiR family transcriptional regulator
VIRDIATLQELLSNVSERDLDVTARLLKEADTILSPVSYVRNR